MGGSSEKNKNAELILIPSPGIGHLTSSLEFAQLLINRDNRLSVTILCIKFPFTPFADSYIRTALASQPKIKLIDLPLVEPPPRELALNSPEHYIWTFMESLKPHVRAIMQNILSQSHWGVCVSLWMELYFGKLVVWGTNIDMAYLCRTTAECFLDGEGIRIGSGA
uniref:Uncharacterized protein n=1 Tax=Glycine max TaxID=3847 RepID=C6TIE4_SOYBN|nr:unknown [Glycine max]